jgi:hypothetical protein
MFWFQRKPLIALGFSDRALDDVDHAMRLLDTYFRPHYIAGTVHELRGDALMALEHRLRGANDTAFADSCARHATKSFDQAHKEFGRALTLVGDAARAPAYTEELRSDFYVRCLKAALRGSDSGWAIEKVLEEEIVWTTSEQHYNVACLYAVASAVADELGRDSQGLAMQAKSHLSAVIEDDATFANVIESDSDLLSAFPCDELREIAQRARGAATPKLSA